MRKINLKGLIKILIFVLMVGLLAFSAKSIYGYLSRAGRVKQELVEAHRPHLDVNLIKKAAEILKSSE